MTMAMASSAPCNSSLTQEHIHTPRRQNNGSVLHLPFHRRRRSNPLLLLRTTGRTCSNGRLSYVVAASLSDSDSDSNTPTNDSVLRHFHQRKALKIISGLQNFDKKNVASVIVAADKGGATHVDIASDPELVKLARKLTTLPICVSSVDPVSFVPAVDAGAQMVEIGNYDSFYEMGRTFSSEQILKLTQETRKLLPSVTLSVTVPHTLSLPDQVKLAELLEQEGADVIQTEGGKCSNPSKAGILGLIEKATPTLAAAYSISRAVKIPVMCSSGLSSVTAPMALTAGAAGVGVGSAVNRLDDLIAMIAEVRNIAESMGLHTASQGPLQDLTTDADTTYNWRA